MKKKVTLVTRVQVLTLFLLISLLLIAEWIQPASAATDGEQMAERVWYDVDEKSIESQGIRRVIPDLYRTLRIDYDALVNRLDRAPMEFTDAAYVSDTVMVIPLPDGVNERFRIFESPVMAQGLATKFPEIKTYSAIGVDDPHASGRLDLTPAGFHAMIFSTSGTFYIDPYSVGDASFYISYFKQDYSAPEDLVYEELGPLGDPGPLEPPAEFISGENLRTHRLAQATTGEYSQFHGGTVPSVMAEVVTAINRVTGIYEREVAVRLELIANTDDLFYLNPATDPYTNNDGFAMLGQNQATIDAVIGNANYDIGHVFSTGGGGIASLRAVCNTGQKALGVTGQSSPIGDPFYVDYVAHEMGHQYGGHHTFNGTASNCAGNRTGPTA
ncbi:MAG: zinc-dependent metalloprotease family protein, partial [Candidatus Promineifilaceae bacterium]